MVIIDHGSGLRRSTQMMYHVLSVHRRSRGTLRHHQRVRARGDVLLLPPDRRRRLLQEVHLVEATHHGAAVGESQRVNAECVKL